MKHYARIEIAKEVYFAREKSVKLSTIFGDVYAPKPKVTVERESVNSLVVLIPCSIFWNKDLNPCQMVRGYIEQVKQ